MFDTINNILFNVLHQMTKNEADIAEWVCRWTNEEKTAFLISKKLFDEAIKKEERKAKRKPKKKNW